MKFLAVTACILLGACGLIGNKPIVVDQTSTLGKDFLAASSNFDNAVKVGALDPTDPAPVCAHAINIMLGLEGPPGETFKPENVGLISLASILYIRAQQLKKIQAAGLTVTPECKQLIGQIVLDAAAAGFKILPGGGLLVP